MNIGNKIKALRLKKGVTQEQMSQELGLSAQAVSKWENNVNAPDIAMLPELAVYFGVSIDELFDMSSEQKLNRIDNMLDLQSELSDKEFNETAVFLNERLAAGDEDRGRIYSMLGHLHNHRIESDSLKVKDYARKAMRLNPGLKRDQWLLNKAESAAVCDWNIRQHQSVISFFKELVETNPDVGINYLYLLDNLLADHRTKEARVYLDRYLKLKKHASFNEPLYRARIAFAEYRSEEAWKILADYEKANPDNPIMLFEMAGFYAGECMYEKAYDYYERSYELDAKPRMVDALEGMSLICEICGDYDKAIECKERIRKNCIEEWNYTEGAPIDEIDCEIQRLRNLKK